MKYGRCFTVATRHLTPAAVKYNESLNSCLWKQTNTQKNKNRRLDFIKSIHIKLCNLRGCIRPLAMD